MSDEPDRMTLQRARRHDREAQALVLRALQDRLWRVCRALVRERSAAEEAVQETSLRILAGLERFDGRSRLTTWATGIAVNVCREQARRRMHVTLDTRTLHAFASVPLTEGDELERLYGAMEQLPQRQREALTLRFLEGLDVKQTAELMGCAPGSVKAAVHAGMSNLRRMMTP